MKLQALRFVRRALVGLIGLGLCGVVGATEFSANFKDADINELITTVGRNLNKTIIVDPAVRGKVNVRSYDLLTEEQYYQFFLSVLDVYGFAVIDMPNGVSKVVRAKDAKAGAIPVVDRDDQATGDEMVTRVVAVKNVSVRELAPLLRQLNDNAGGGNVVHYDPSNVIMLTGRAAVVNRLVEIIRRVDKAGDQEVDIIRLKFASAGELVRILDSLTANTGAKGASASLLIPKVVADERTNSIVVSGEPSARARIVRLVTKLDSELQTYGNTRVFYLKYAKAIDLVDVLKGVSETVTAEAAGGSKKSSSSNSRGNFSIEAHEDTNALVITAQPDNMRTLEGVINQLDIRRAQVHVEAIIVEVAEGDGVSLGVQWATQAGGTQFNDSGVSIGELGAGIYDAQPTKGSTVCTGETCTVNPDTPGDISGLASSLAKISGAAFGFYGADWGVLIQAAANDSRSNLLATPSITTMDNMEAYFTVGEEVPVLTGSASSSSNDNPFTTVDRKEVGIKLKVTPQINEGDAVQLTIEQEVSKVQGQTSVDVVFAKRQLQTTVLVDSGDTIILGGLLDDQIEESESKVPLLGDIPVLGHLFRSTNSKKTKRNLMIFIRPTIIRDSVTMQNVSSRKYSQIRAQQLLREELGVALMPETKVPVLPEFNSVEDVSPEVQEYIDFLKDKNERLKKEEADKAAKQESANPKQVSAE
ncbi:type II secretion system secretin GspD [Agarivorans sp. MS3-6]|uniref:type II secretion system secretin GspD n=1 Tax=Agarivorans sp. TSD2052 TaxID=2937286 RepID=UPI00200BE1B4|nr:type II secretion system secretin GspD [Agarivorans sp. TSD2052]UPW18252.1 type II secretion system secretin GspD [Agarivorans sp. TSD2052]